MKLKAIKLVIYFVVGLLGFLLIGFFYESQENGGGGGGGYLPASCTEGDVNEALIEGYLGGSFVGKKDVFMNAARANNIDPVLLVAIAGHETGNGTSHAVKNRNNPGGLMNPQTNWQTLIQYESLDKGIDAMASNLYRLYINQGLFAIDQIGQKYAPIGVENDPTNLNKHWVPTVTSLAAQLGGLSMNCKVVGTGEFVMPTASGMNINSPFGYRTHPISGEWKLHAGLDFDCNYGDPIVAAQNGKVVVTSGKTGFGNHVIIDHGDKYTLYAHLSSIGVGLTDVVAAGQPIGNCGSTGASTGPHLHFEVQQFLYGGWVDPYPFFQNKKEEV